MTGLGNRASTWEGFPVLPMGYTTYSNDVLGHHARSFFGSGPGLVLVLYDAWAIDPEAVAGLATAVWAPVHSWPLSGGDKRFWITTGAQPIAISRYGETQMREFGLQPCYVPHGIDTQAFRPLSSAERAEARQVMGVPQDAFVIAIVAGNKGTSPPRKAWGEQFQAFARFRETHPDAVLYVHSLANSPHGIDMRPMAASLGIEKHIYFSADYPQVAGLYGPGFVAGVMGAADVLSNPSYGEGFGLPVVEAQACGTPVVVADNSAQPELCGAGWVVSCQPVWVPQDTAWWHVPLIGRIGKAWDAAYQARGDQQLRDKARAFAEQYDADLVAATYWKPVLEMLEQYAGAAPVRLPAEGAVPLPTRESDGLQWVQRGSHTDDWIATGHEETLAPVLDTLLPAGGVFVDVGAHVGRWALRMARKASQVVAVEANPDTAAVLRYHIALNDVGNVTVAEVAAWDTRARMKLDDPNHRVSGGSTRVVPRPPASGAGVRAMPLDDAPELAALDRIDLIKLDVEGADLHALRGLRGTLDRCRPVLLIERHDIYGYYQLDDLTGLLTELGYACQDVTIPLAGDRHAPYIAAKPLPRTKAEQIAESAVWLGASQHEGELAAAVELVTTAQPAVVAEIGCDLGATLYAWQQAAPGAAVYGITTADNSFTSGGSRRPLVPHGATVHIGDSHDPASLGWLAGELAGQPIDVLVIDGDHTPAGVRQDLAHYAPLVRPGGLILLHDITETGDPRSQVWRVWPDLRTRHHTTEITQPGGYGWGIIHIPGQETGDG